MSDNLFRAREEITAAKLNRIIRDVGADAGQAAADGLVATAVGVLFDGDGVDTTGSNNVHTLLSAAIVANTEAGKPTLIGPGDYALGADVLLVSGAKIIMTPRTRLIRRYSGGSIFTQASLLTPLVGVEIHGNGGAIVNPDPATYTTGRSLSLYLDRSLIDGLYLDGHNDAGVVALLRLTRSSMSRIVHIEPTRTGGGISLHGSTDSRVSDCYVDSDDDCYQVGATGQESSPLFGLDTRGVQYVNCTGRSRNARLMVVGAARAGVEPLISDANVTDCAFIGVRGSGRLGVTVVNTLLTGKVARIDFIGCQVDCSSDTTGGAAAFAITDDNVAGSGGVEDIRIVGGGITSPYHSAINVYGTAVKRVSFTDFFVGAPRGTRESIRINGYADVVFSKCSIEAPTDDNAAWVGFGDGANLARATFRDCRFFNIYNGYNGLVVYTSQRVVIDGCRFQQASGQTTARAFSVTDGSLNVTVGSNDFEDITPAEKFVWPNATQNSGCRIERQVLQVITTNTTAREPFSGTRYILTGATGRTLTLSGAGFALEFGGVQSGSGALKIQAAAGDTILIGTAASTAGGYIESGSVGATVQLIGLNDTTWQAVTFAGTWTVA